jgi:hypothetical protein
MSEAVQENAKSYVPYVHKQLRGEGDYTFILVVDGDSTRPVASPVGFDCPF